MRRTFEIVTTGFDEFLQGVGGDPLNGGSFVGLRVPTLASGVVGATPGLNNRYLFMGASFSMGEGGKARILGYRQLVTIGATQGAGNTLRFVEQEVVTPTWRFQDGNVSFHFRRMGPPNAAGLPFFQGPALDRVSFKRGWAVTPALLYETATLAAGNPSYISLTAYTPPNGVLKAGTPLNGEPAGSLYGLQCPWRTADAWTSLDIDVEGPDTIACFISVKQTNPSTRTALTPPGGGFVSGGIPPEEAFLQNFPTAVYWRVGVALIVELCGDSP